MALFPRGNDSNEKEDTIKKIENVVTTGRSSFRPPKDLGEAVENKVIEDLIKEED